MCFSECEAITDDRPLRQGDLIRSTRPDPSLFEAVGVIVTADCDIAHEKHAGLLSFVPVVPAADYAELFLMPKHFERIQSALGEQIGDLARAFQELNRPEYARPLTTERVLSWLSEVGPETVADQLAIYDPEIRTKFHNQATAYLDLTQTAAEPLPKRWSTQIKAMLATGRASTPSKAAHRLLSDIEGALKKLPGDALYLNSIGTATGSHVAYLRLIREIRDHQIALSPMRQSYDVTYERFGRLKTPYVYHLTQKLGNVFSSIGLPSEYESARAATVTAVLPPELREGEAD